MLPDGEVCAQDHHPTLWFSDDGSRVGTYIGHNGAVNTCDVSRALSSTHACPATAPAHTAPHSTLSAGAYISTVAGAVDSQTLLTGSSDSTAKLWEVETGRNTHTFKFQAPCRAVAFSLGESHAALSVDPFMQAPPAVHILRIADDPADQEDKPQQTLTDFTKRINRAIFTDLNAVLLTAGEDGFVRRWDVEVRAPDALCMCNQ